MYKFSIIVVSVFSTLQVIVSGEVQGAQEFQEMTLINPCAQALQGRVAWNYHGNTDWNPDNIQRLCGEQASPEPAICFNEVMHGGVSWGGGNQWEWENAVDLCEGSQNASATVGCFRNQVTERGEWRTAIQNCSAPQGFQLPLGESVGTVTIPPDNSAPFQLPTGGLDQIEFPSSGLEVELPPIQIVNRSHVQEFTQFDSPGLPILLDSS